MIRLEPGRQANEFADASSPYRSASGVSQPPPADHELMPACVDAVIDESAASILKGVVSQLKSLYDAAPKLDVGCAARTLFMTLVAFAFTFPIADPIDPVVSARNTRSGFGGIVLVCTVLAMVIESPGSIVAVTFDGVTPAGPVAEATLPTA